MKTFEEYLDKMGYSWNDFDRAYEMEGLIEQYADERIKQALTIPVVVGRSEQLPICSCENTERIDVGGGDWVIHCKDCGKNW